MDEHLYFFSGDHQMAIKYVEEAFEEARKLQDIDWMAPLCFSLCVSYQGIGRYQRIVEIAPEVIALIEKTGREFDSFGRTSNPYVMICGYCGQSMGITGHFSEGRVFIEKSRRHANQLTDTVSLASVELSTGIFFFYKGDWKAAKKHLEKAISAAEDEMFAFVSTIAMSFLGFSCTNSGDPESGREPAERGLQIFKQSETKGFLSAAYLFISGCCLPGPE